MCSIIKSSLSPKTWMKNKAILINAVRTHYMKDYKPGPYPHTEEERMAAAEKYGLPYSEYKPYSDDGYGYGDYPELPLVSADAKDPHYPWDFPELKRNFNETLHAEFDLIREDRYDISARTRRPLPVMLAHCLGAMFSYAIAFFLFENVRMFPAAFPQQRPGDGCKHYTFEPKPKK